MVYEGPVGPKMVTGLFFPQGNCPGCMLYFFVVLLDGNLGFIEVVYRLSFPYLVFFIISYHIPVVVFSFLKMTDSVFGFQLAGY